MAMRGLEIKHKRELHLWSWVFWIVLLSLIAAVSWFTYRYITTGELPPGITAKALGAGPSVDESPVTDAQIRDYKVADDQPRYISIPSLNVGNTRIYPVGLTNTNQLDMPKNISDAGWYNKSAKPGQGYGVVMIDGHANGISRDGVFAKLSTLPKDAEIIIERGDGQKFTYKVVDNQSMPFQKAITSGMQTMAQPVDDSSESLSIMTDNGNWIPKDQQYERRIILRAVRVN